MKTKKNLTINSSFQYALVNVFKYINDNAYLESMD
jgi:hypothetical protein